ncbi:MAG: hypothetical protein HFJ06_02130 [Lachnospiraceae bacterium]|nr:hypothetical protein [Lachnospiraceae bacterium]
MKQMQDREIAKGEMQKENADQERISRMLQNAYSIGEVPAEVNIRLKNRIACQQAAGEGRISFWWLPAVVNTVISAAGGCLIYMVYVLVNIKGADFCMPNLLEFISGTWLKLHMAVVMSEMVLSWIFTFICIWKGSLVQRAKMF